MSDTTEEEVTFVDLDRSSYSQVVFIDVPPVYTQNTSVTCSYQLTAGLKPTAKDWIGIYKVGWASVHKYYSYVWVEMNNFVDHNDLEPLKQQVIFKDFHLPKDDGEFYQFCYVDSSGQVRGASTPFRIQNSTETSLDWSLESDILVVATQEQVVQMEKEKQTLQTENEHLSEENKILKNELDDRLHEIHHLRQQIGTLKSNSGSESSPVNELMPQNHNQQLTGPEESKSYQESPSLLGEKFEKALQKISRLKQEKETQQIEIAELKSRIKKSEQDSIQVEDHLQLLQVDLQSSQRENERLHTELEVVRKDLQKLKENNNVNTIMSEHTPSEGDNNAKMQIQTLESQLSEARAILCKEIKNCSEANKRAEKAELELTDLQKQFKQRIATEDWNKEKKQIEKELEDARQKLTDQKKLAAAAQIEKEELSAENENLKKQVKELQKLISDLELNSQPSVYEIPQEHETGHFTSSTSVEDHIYESIRSVSGFPTDINETKVCRHCQERFPDITESELEAHEQSHMVCPFCTLICDSMTQQEFEDHVYSHEE